VERATVVTSDPPAGVAAVPAKRPSRAGRDLSASIAVSVALIALIIASLVFVKDLFLVVVVAASLVAVWELSSALGTNGIQVTVIPAAGGTVSMIVGAYYGGTAALVVALAVTALVCLLWRMPAGAPGFVRDTTATLFCLVYAPFLASFVALLLHPADGVRRVMTFIAVTIASDIGGYAIGALFGKHPMSPVISPKKSWEGFAGSAIACLTVGVVSVVYLLDGRWWVGLLLGAAAVVAATLGDLIESLVKRDLGIKDMSNLLPGHGGIMDRLDSLLANVSVAYLILQFLV
jgi:phosphatidate cytidylyltransferase